MVDMERLRKSHGEEIAFTHQNLSKRSGLCKGDSRDSTIYQDRLWTGVPFPCAFDFKMVLLSTETCERRFLHSPGTSELCSLHLYLVTLLINCLLNVALSHFLPPEEWPLNRAKAVTGSWLNWSNAENRDSSFSFIWFPVEQGTARECQGLIILSPGTHLQSLCLRGLFVDKSMTASRLESLCYPQGHHMRNLLV